LRHASPADTWRACAQSYVLRSAGKTIVVDTGFGNHKERPYFPVGTHLNTDFLARLEAVGVKAADVDAVVCTHLHIDHVGWNTRLEGREWVPTFVNATYHFARADVDFWNPMNGHHPRGERLNQNVFEDSVAPILQAGKAAVWEGDSLQLDENLRLDAASGHTPGTAVLSLDSGGERALFVGDIAHSPIQMINPDWNSCFDEDELEARRARHRVIARAADEKWLMFAAHFSGGRAIEISRQGDRYAFAGWTPFETEQAFGNSLG
jgi:glyoxylase-like metal-dependent hydrolase (beta-lactamase superfamily II)